MARLKIKSRNPKEHTRKTALLEILAKNDIFINKLLPINDGFIALTCTDNDLDKIFERTVTQELEEKDFYPQIPLELRAKRSIIIFNADLFIYSNSEEDIKDEIMTKNEWANEQIDSIFTFPNSNNLKITFAQSVLATKAKQQGIRLFSMSIAPHQIQQEEFHNIKTCFKCYAIEDHNTNQCPSPKEYIICSECAEEGHTWNNCTNNNKKCINCGGNH